MRALRTTRNLRHLTLASFLLVVFVQYSRADYTVTGRFQYQDREFGLDGFTGTITPRPIRFAEVRIMAGAGTLATGSTSLDGSFVIQVPGSVAQQVTAVCLSSAPRNSAMLLSVRVAKDDYTFGDYYAVASLPVQAGGAGTVDLGTTTAEATIDVGRAFNIWDVVVDALQFVASPAAKAAFPTAGLTVIWRETHLRTGSFYQYQTVGGHAVFVGSTAAWDDTVISHEFGHYLDSLYSKSDSPGGTHYIGDNNQDIRLSWSEGLATFLGSSIRQFKGYNRPDIYASTDGSRLNFSYDVESVSEGRATIASKTGSTNEVAVTAALWDITDGPSTQDGSPGVDDDPLERPFRDAWTVLTVYLPTITEPAISIEDFWDGWFSPQVNNGYLAQMQQLFARTNGIEFIPDTQEPDDAAAVARTLTPEQLPPLVAGARVVINEIDLGSIDAVELYNAGAQDADLTGWTVAGVASGYPTVFLTIPSFKLRAGAVVVLSESVGVDSSSVLYFGTNISWSNGNDGACVLRNAAGLGIDFVSWGKSTEPVPAPTGFKGPNPPSPPAGMDLARDFFGTDTNAGSDFRAQTSTLGTYNLNGQERHYTYYGHGDVDYIAVSAREGRNYLFETMNLGSGGDTIVDLLAPDGSTVLATNDDFGSSKASRLVWTAAASGRYYLRSRRFAGVSNLARYGSYDLRIIESTSGFGLALPETLTVSQPGQGGRFDRIPEAISAASNGDTIEILDSATYGEPVTIAGKSITVKAAPGKSPAIDARGLYRLPGLTVSNAKTVVLEGLRIVGGTRGIRITGGAVTVIDTIVTGASDSAGYADGIQVVGSGSSLTLVNSTVVRNGRLGVGLFQSASARIANSIMQGNGIRDLDWDTSVSRYSVQNSLVNTSSLGPGRGNIAGDPRFVDADNGNFRLRPDSPCIDRGDPLDGDLPSMDADGIPRNLDGNGDGLAAPDMGAFEYLPAGLLTSTAVFPQVAAGGTYPTYRTTIVALNPGSVTATATLTLTRSDGSPFPAPNLNPGTMSAINVPVPPLGIARFDTGASGALAAGYARILSNVPVSGTALLRAINGNTLRSEAAVGLSKLSRSLTVYVDNLGSANSGYAIANSGTGPVGLSLVLRDREGIRRDTQFHTLGAGEHIAEFAFQRFRAAGRGFEGSVEIQADQPVAATALRFDNAAADVFSTVPVLVDEAATTLHFPQVADGGGYRTNLVLLNPTTAAAMVKVEFFGDDGNALTLPVGGIPATSYTLALPARGAAHLLTDGTSPDIRAGWARVTSTAPIGGTAIFETRNGDWVLSEAGVSSSPAASRLIAYVESLGDTESGLALSNPNSGAVDIRINLRNASGQVVASATLSLPPMGHVARFFTQWFPERFAEFEGTLEVVATAPVAAVALRYDGPLADVFATLPVIPLP